MKLDETISRYLLTARYHAESGEARIMEEILSLLKDVPSSDTSTVFLSTCYQNFFPVPLVALICRIFSGLFFQQFLR